MQYFWKCAKKTIKKKNRKHGLKKDSGNRNRSCSQRERERKDCEQSKSTDKQGSNFRNLL